MSDKRANFAGPGIGDYAELEKVLPQDYVSLLSPKETQKALFAAKGFIEARLCEAPNGDILVWNPVHAGGTSYLRWGFGSTPRRSRSSSKSPDSSTS